LCDGDKACGLQSQSGLYRNNGLLVGIEGPGRAAVDLGDQAGVTAYALLKTKAQCSGSPASLRIEEGIRGRRIGDAVIAFALHSATAAAAEKTAAGKARTK
jgi:hypothetical protein